MFRTSSTKILFLIALLGISNAYNMGGGFKCVHDQYYRDAPQLLDVEEEFLSNQTRFLQSSSSYPNIRMSVDYTNFVDGTTDFKNYVKTQLLPPIISYFENAIAVKQPLTSPIKLSTSYKTICDYTTPSALFTGVTTDFYLIVTSTSDTQNWVASGGACYLSTTTKRPIIARMMFNMVYTTATTDVLIHERNTYLTLHEMIHALGFTGSNFVNFIDASGNTLTGHIKTVLLNGSNRTVLDVPSLTTKLRSYFGCSTLPGAFMEDDGGAGTAGSHFERRHFLYEVMTSGVMDGHRVSNFSLGVLEASGWYQPNYTYAEPFFFGQGEGCNFLYQDCTASTFSSYNFAEFCTGATRGCTPVGIGGGVCASDSRSDGCTYYFPSLDYNCQDPSAVDNARLPTAEVFGRSAGSKCFEGTLTKLTTKTSQTSMCFTYTCSGSGLTTTLEVTVGTVKATCKAEGSLSVTGYNGVLSCPDPLTFCSTVGKKYCPRNCMGRGKCVNNQCVCTSPYTGIDCGISGTLTAVSS